MNDELIEYTPEIAPNVSCEVEVGCMSYLKYFEEQLSTAEPITLKHIDQMRQTRSEVCSDPEQLEQVLKSARLNDDQLVGRKIVFFLARKKVAPNMYEVSALSSFDDEIEQLAERWVPVLGANGNNPQPGTLPRFMEK